MPAPGDDLVFPAGAANLGSYTLSTFGAGQVHLAGEISGAGGYDLRVFFY